MSERTFRPIAEALRSAVLSHYAERGHELTGVAGTNTLETNSGLVERRGEPLVEILRGRGVTSLEGLRVADLGCGFGALSVFFAWHGADVVGIDPNGSRTAVGRSVGDDFNLSVRFIRGGMQDLSRLDSRSFDIAVQNNSYCYIVDRDERARALGETFRILRTGGRLVARNPNRWHPFDPFTGLPLLQLLGPERAVAVAARLGRKRSLVRLTSPAGARRELRAAGFDEIELVSPRHGRRHTLRYVARYHHMLACRP